MKHLNCISSHCPSSNCLTARRRKSTRSLQKEWCRSSTLRQARKRCSLGCKCRARIHLIRIMRLRTWAACRALPDNSLACSSKNFRHYCSRKFGHRTCSRTLHSLWGKSTKFRRARSTVFQAGTSGTFHPRKSAGSQLYTKRSTRPARTLRCRTQACKAVLE